MEQNFSEIPEKRITFLEYFLDFLPVDFRFILPRRIFEFLTWTVRFSKIRQSVETSVGHSPIIRLDLEVQEFLIQAG